MVLNIDKGRKRISLGPETSRAEGTQQDYKEYLKQQKSEAGTGLGILANAFEKLREAGGENAG